jgi:hypothetical protein
VFKSILPLPIEVTVLGRLIEEILELCIAKFAIAVTPSGTTADPIQPEFVVTVVFEIINEPPPEQTTGAKSTPSVNVWVASGVEAFRAVIV